MRKTVLLLIVLLAGITGFSQKAKIGLKPYAAGLGYHFSSTNFFEGYNHEILYANSKAGLPLLSDWNQFSSFLFKPEFQQYTGWFTLADSSGRLRMRISGAYAQRKDMLVSTSIFSQNDTAIGRTAVEQVKFYSAGWGISISTKLYFKFLKLYAGGEVELGFSPTSDIEFFQYQFDSREGGIILQDEFNTKGKPRFTPYASALVGMELCFFNRISFTGEMKSGVGGHVVVREKVIGLSKSQILLGMNYFFSGYK